MLNGIRNLCLALEEIEQTLTLSIKEILIAAGHPDDFLTYKPYKDTNPIKDVYLFLRGKESCIGGQLNNIFILLDFLLNDVTFTVRHRQQHKVSMLHDEKEFAKEAVDEG